MMKRASIKSFFTKDKSPKTPTEEVWGELCTTKTPPQQYTPSKSSKFSPKKSPNKHSPKSPSPTKLSPKTNSSINRGRVNQSSSRDGGIVNRRVSDSNARQATSVRSPRSSRSLSRPKKAMSQRDNQTRKHNNGKRFPLANYKSQSAVDLDAPIEAYDGPIDCDEVSFSSGSEHGKGENNIDLDANSNIAGTHSGEASFEDVGTERINPDSIPLGYEDCSGFRPSTPDNVDIEKPPLTMRFTNDETIDLPKDADDETVYSLTATHSEESIIAPMSMDEMENKNASMLGRMETDDSALDDGDYYRQDYFSMMTKSKRGLYEDESLDHNKEEYEGEPTASLSERVLMTEESEVGAGNRLSSCELTGITEPELPQGMKRDCEEEEDYGDLYTDASFPMCGDEEENQQNNTPAIVPSLDSNDGGDLVIERNENSKVQDKIAPFLPDDGEFILEGHDGDVVVIDHDATHCRSHSEDSVECNELVEKLDIANISVQKEIISLDNEDLIIDQDCRNYESDRCLDQSNNATLVLDNLCQNDIAHGTLEQNAVESNAMQLDESNNANHSITQSIFESNDDESSVVQLDESGNAAADVEKICSTKTGGATKLLNGDMNIAECNLEANEAQGNGVQFDERDKATALMETEERDITEANGDGDSDQLDESGKAASDSKKVTDDNFTSKICGKDIAAAVVDTYTADEMCSTSNAFETNSSDANGHEEMEKDETKESDYSSSDLDAPKSATTEGSVCKREIDIEIMNQTNLVVEETNDENISILQLLQFHENDQPLETDSLPIMCSRSRSLSPSLRTTNVSSVEKPYFIKRTTSLPVRWKPFPSSNPANSSLQSRSLGTCPKENLEHCSKTNTPLTVPSLETSSVDISKIIHENQRLRVKRQQLCSSLSNMARQIQLQENAYSEKIFSLEQKIRALSAEKGSSLPVVVKTEGCYDASTVHRLSNGVLELSKEIEAKDKIISRLMLRFRVLKRTEDERETLEEFTTSQERKRLQTELFESRAALKNALSDIDALTAALESNNGVLDECVEELESLRQFKSSHIKESLHTPVISRTSMPTLITKASKDHQSEIDVTPLNEEVQLLRKEANSARFELGLANQHIQQLSAELNKQTEHVNVSLLSPNSHCQTEGMKDGKKTTDLEQKIAELERKVAEYENSSSVKNEFCGDFTSSNETEPLEELISTESPSKLLTARKLFQPLRGWAASPRVNKSLSSETSHTTNDVAELQNIIKTNAEVMEKLKRDIIKVQSDKDETEFEMQNEIQRLKEENNAYASQVTVLEESFRKMNDIRASGGDNIDAHSETSNSSHEFDLQSNTISLQRSITELESTQSCQENEIERLKSELVKLRVTSQQDKEAALYQLREEVAIVTAQRTALETQLVEINKFAGHLRNSLDDQTSLNPTIGGKSTTSDKPELSIGACGDSSRGGKDPMLVAQVVMLETANTVLEQNVNSLRLELRQKLTPLLEKVSMLEEEKRIMEDETNVKLACREMTIKNLENSLQQSRFGSGKKKRQVIFDTPSSE
eukprot:scaffold9678_cov79-Cyclotella_meneghiniana.AAC.3